MTTKQIKIIARITSPIDDGFYAYEELNKPKVRLSEDIMVSITGLNKRIELKRGDIVEIIIRVVS